jgi:formate hydrogenlyase subunit 6/NADH:ubiquinone oxidoreductase subunit I
VLKKFQSYGAGFIEIGVIFVIENSINWFKKCILCKLCYNMCSSFIGIFSLIFLKNMDKNTTIMVLDCTHCFDI